MLGRDNKKSLGGGSASTHTLIADGTEIKGDILFSGGLHIQGKVIGNIASESDQGQLIIGETGSVEGEVKVARVVVNGHVNGNIHASEHLELAEKAEVMGNVFYNVIEMLMGARVNGKLVRQDGRRNLPSPDQIGAALDDDAGNNAL
jgi:cytoskeletal protein CcmA (bactofilin family)